jgi:hypothetical protein
VTPTTKAIRRTLRRMLTKAETGGDATAAASVSRALLNVEEFETKNATPTAEEAAPGSREENQLIVRSMTAVEREEWRQLLVQFKALRNQVLERIGRPPEPKSAIDRPTPMFQFCGRCEGFNSFWSADDARQADLLVEFFGEGQMRTFLEFAEAAQ